MRAHASYSSTHMQVDKCRKLGANVILKGTHIGEAKDFAMSSPEFDHTARAINEW